MKKNPPESFGFSARFLAARGEEIPAPPTHCSEWNYTNGNANLAARLSLWRQLGSPRTARARARRAAVPLAKIVIREPLASLR